MNHKATKITLYKVVKLLNEVKPTTIASNGGIKLTTIDVAKKVTFQITFLSLLKTLFFGLSSGNWVEITTAFPAPKETVNADVAIVKTCKNVGRIPVKMKRMTTKNCKINCKDDSTASSVKLINPLNLFQASP